MTANGSLTGRRCVVVGGAGAVGGMFADLLAGAGAEVRVVDVARGDHDGRHAFTRGDVTAIDARLGAQLRGADAVVLAVPADAAEQALPGVAARLRPGALLADTLSVKGGIAAAARRHAAHLQVVSVNPLFAPSLGIAGRPLAAVVVHDGPQARALLRLLADAGGRVVEVTADEHDALAGAAQALPHAAVLAFGLALADLGVDVDRLAGLAPPPCQTLLALLARIAAGAPATYWDVQTANPHAAGARAALAGGLRRLATAIDRGDERAFGALLAQLDLGDSAATYQELCSHIFDQVTPDQPKVKR